MVECEGGFPLLVVSPRLDILIAHDLIAIIISTALSMSLLSAYLSNY